ncbi:MAG: superoxide dismutase family protein [Pseudonocardiaceae bacterium]
MTSRSPLFQRVTVAAVGVAVALGPLGCSSKESSSPSPPAATGTGEETPALELSGSGTLTTPGQTSNAFTYNPALAPVGARIAITLTPSGGSTTATFEASGLLPNRGYAVHLHTNPCGLTGEAAGPHFQRNVDPAATPEKPSTNPEYANPTNEFWLDVRTGATGSGTSQTTVPFLLTDRVPASVVVHEGMTTATEPGKAGTAGGRLACLTLPKV